MFISFATTSNDGKRAKTNLKITPHLTKQPKKVGWTTLSRVSPLDVVVLVPPVAGRAK